jgi:hypothetical protein
VSLRIVLGAMVASVPGHGGATWAALQYALGLRELGHEVLILDEAHGEGEIERRALALGEVEAAFGFEGRAAMLAGGGSLGLSYEEVLAFAADADLLVNLAGTVRDAAVLDAVPRRLFVDLDPAFTQLWHTQGIDLGLDRHTSFASVGLTLHERDCTVPDCGRRWRPTLPPIALDHWPAATAAPSEGVTAIANWRSYGSIEHEGVRHGQKAHSTRELIDLPALAGEPIRFALLIDSGEEADIRGLRSHGWELIDPVAATATCERYARFVRSSAAELGIAKEGYVLSRCGWFSDRSACYLASGRPVLAQRTGWERALPEGLGLLGFSSAAEAAQQLALLRREPQRHAQAARALAEEHLDARRVLPELLAGALP